MHQKVDILLNCYYHFKISQQQKQQENQQILTPYGFNVLKEIYLTPKQNEYQHCCICTRKHIQLIKINSDTFVCLDCYQLKVLQNKFNIQQYNFIQPQYFTPQSLYQQLQQVQQQQKQIPDYFINLSTPFQENIYDESMIRNQYTAGMQQVNYILCVSNDCIQNIEDVHITPILTPILFGQMIPNTAYSFNQCILMQNLQKYQEQYQIYLQITTPDFHIFNNIIKYQPNDENLSAIRFLIQSTVSGIYKIEVFFIPFDQSTNKMLYWNTKLLAIQLDHREYKLSAQSKLLLEEFEQFFEQLKLTKKQLQLDDINCIVVMMQSSISGQEIQKLLETILKFAENEKNLHLFQQSGTFIQNIQYLYTNYNQYEVILKQIINLCEKLNILQEETQYYQNIISIYDQKEQQQQLEKENEDQKSKQNIESQQSQQSQQLQESQKEEQEEQIQEEQPEEVQQQQITNQQDKQIQKNIVEEIQQQIIQVQQQVQKELNQQQNQDQQQQNIENKNQIQQQIQQQDQPEELEEQQEEQQENKNRQVLQNHITKEQGEQDIQQSIN